MTALLEVRGVTKTYGSGGVFGQRRVITAVEDVSLEVAKGETLALVGESGSGKSTTGRMVMNLIEPDSGEILFDGHSILKASPAERQTLRQRMQIIFQDPYASLNPRKPISHILGLPLSIHRGGSTRLYRPQAIRMLEMVGLSPGERYIDRMPHEFSGGQRQRIAIARALMLDPEFIVADEAVSALDVSVQAQILQLLTQLQAQYGLTFLFITHDLAVVRAIAQRVAVMHRGRIVETGRVEEVFAAPRHEYTRTLLDASLLPDPAIARKRFMRPVGAPQKPPDP